MFDDYDPGDNTWNTLFTIWAMAGYLVGMGVGILLTDSFLLYVVITLVGWIAPCVLFGYLDERHRRKLGLR